MYDKIVPAIRKPFEEWTHEEFTGELKNRFLYAEEIADALYFALKYKQNCLLYGPKGHAKTDIVDYALAMIATDEQLYKECFFLDCGPSMDVKPIMGFLDLPKYRDSGELEYKLDRSMFVAFKRARLDEIFQAPEQLLLFMRSVISTGKICPNDGICYPSQMGTIFACTNVNPTEWAEGDEVKGSFVDRFTLRVEVKWPEYTQAAFNAMFQKRTDTESPVWAEICEMLRKETGSFSPRSAMIGKGMYETDGLVAIRNFDGITTELFDKAKKIHNEHDYLSIAWQLAERSVEIATRLNEGTALTLAEVTALHAETLEMSNTFEKLEIPKDAKKYENVADTKKRLRQNLLTAYNIMKKLQQSDGSGSNSITNVWR